MEEKISRRKQLRKDEGEKTLEELSLIHILIERRPVLGERIKVVTWPYAVKGLYALRNFAILDENGGYLVKANSYWFLMNTETGRPMRILESDTAPYGEFSPKIEMEDAGRKIAVPKEMEEAGRLVVMKDVYKRQPLYLCHRLASIARFRWIPDWNPAS